MKKNLKMAFVLFVSAMNYVVNAQENWGFVLKGGMSINNVSYKKAVDTKYVMGYHIGAAYQIGTSEISALEIGLLLETRGGKYTAYDEYRIGILDARTGKRGEENLLVLNLPIYFKCNLIPIGRDSYIYGSAGPYVDMVLTGEGKVTLIDSPYTEFKYDREFARFAEFGLGLDVGVQFGHYFLQIGYQNGFYNTDSYAKFSTGKIGIGYKF